MILMLEFRHFLHERLSYGGLRYLGLMNVGEEKKQKYSEA